MARRKDVLLINVWRDGLADWRGSIEHMRTKRRRYFTDLIDIVAFLADYTNAADTEERRHDA